MEAERRREDRRRQREERARHGGRPDLLKPGANIARAYTVESLIGRGAYGDVYRARHTGSDELYALKLLAAGSDSGSEQLVSEARALTKVSNRHVVEMVDVGEYRSAIGRLPFLVMELASGPTLATQVSQRIRFSIDEALGVADQLLSALEATHGLDPPVVHGYISPRNVFLTDQSPVSLKLSDFGIARLAHPDHRLLRTEEIIRYSAPETAWGIATEASDLCSVALILYQLLTGVAAYRAPTGANLTTAAGATAALWQSRENIPSPPSRYRRGLSAAIDSLVLSALAQRAESRFRTASQYRAVLQEVRAAGDKLH